MSAVGLIGILLCLGAVPFFLAHPRLLRLERRMMGDAEGGNRRWRLRLLRHELGHAVDTAFELRRRRDWQHVFGSAAAPYSGDYTAAPRSNGIPSVSKYSGVTAAR